MSSPEYKMRLFSRWKETQCWVIILTLYLGKSRKKRLMLKDIFSLKELRYESEPKICRKSYI